MLGGRRVEQVGRDVFDSGSGKARARSSNRSLRDVERGGMKSPGGELLGIVAQAAADRQRRFPRGLLRMHVPKINQARIGAEIGPWNSALPCFALLIKRLEPAGR